MLATTLPTFSSDHEQSNYDTSHEGAVTTADLPHEVHVPEGSEKNPVHLGTHPEEGAQDFW